MSLLNKLRYARTAASITGAVAAVTTASTLSTAYFITRALTRPQPQLPNDDFTFTPYEFDMPFEEVLFANVTNSHMVRGWWIPRAGSRRVIITCSGYRRNRSDMLGVGHQLWQDGNSILLIDFHGHGHHHGSTITLAYREVDDFLGAVDYAAERVPHAAIGAVGFSMGAAVAIMGAARDRRVQAVVADSPFASHRDVVAVSVKRYVPFAKAIPERPLLALADYMLKWRAGYHFNQVEPVREVGALAPRSLLLIHGTGDEVVPYQHSEQLFAAAGDPKELWLVENAAHCGAYFDDRERYRRVVTQFFDRSLADSQADQDKVG